MGFTSADSQNPLMEMYTLLFDHFGPQHWWPGESPFEIMVGAVLTQNTNWRNVEKAIQNLKSTGRFTLHGIYHMPESELSQHIRPAGYYNIKARRLKNLLYFIMEAYEGDLGKFLNDDMDRLRQGLLSVKGIGPETADSILLYAANKPIFVVDAYTFRILHRHGMIEDQATYDELQGYFLEHLPEDVKLYNEFHALIVQTAKTLCKKKPLCPECPLQGWGNISPHIDFDVQ